MAGVSNTTTHAELLDAFLEATGILPQLACVVYSSAHGYRKPHPSIYHAALAALRVGPGEALFVGDRGREDVIGPQAVGIRAVLTHEFRQEQPRDAAPLAVIGELADLHTVLDAIEQ